MKKMISVLGVIALCSLTTVVSAQNDTKVELGWYNSADGEGVIGASVDAAYKFMGNKKAKYKPVVALIGGGVDFEHEAIKDYLWVNKKEKADGRDNDGNGLVDDINGWNYISSKDGSRQMERLMKEGDREWLRLREKYDGIMTGDGGKTFVKYESDGSVNPVKLDNVNEFFYFRNVVQVERSYNDGGNYQLQGFFKYWIREFDRQIKAREPKKDKYELSDFIACWDKTQPLDTLMGTAMQLFGMYLNFARTTDWNVVYNAYTDPKIYEKGKADFDKALVKTYDSRKEIVGDDYNNLNDKGYGSNKLLTAYSQAGTMNAGIIAGKRGVEGRNNPICENARIMPLVVASGGGEPYVKDMVLAMRYAVDNGADIIILPEQNTLYSPTSKVWMSEALDYAEQKGVLVVISSWNLRCNMDELSFYPNRKMKNGKEFSNLLIVSGSTKNGDPIFESNYGKNSVDMYAPSVEIRSAYIGDQYKLGTNQTFAGAVVAGVAALIKSYYPTLTGSQIRTLLIENVTSRKGYEIEKGIVVGRDPMQDMFLFEQLCTSGGIVNAAKALEAASKMTIK